MQTMKDWKGTPGPWTCQNLGSYVLVEATGKHPIANVYGAFERPEVCAAEAKAIAAVPDLLKAVAGLLWLANDREWEDDAPEIQFAREVLERATV